MSLVGRLRKFSFSESRHSINDRFAKTRPTGIDPKRPLRSLQRRHLRWRSAAEGVCCYNSLDGAFNTTAPG